MKKRPTPTNEKPSARLDSSANSIVPGNFLLRLDTVVAEVLARLLNYETLTGMDGVIDISTTRLAAAVCYLQKHYDWSIPRRKFATGCSDGRVSWCKEYSLDPATVQAAMAAGAGEWCADVRRARAARRAKAAEAKRKAELANAAAAARRRQHSGQTDLFWEAR